jgi:TolB-like protein/tetratricopeptide (TPR) repeat protein
MASIISGYEYDIFISYRQNDNRSGWVTEFVAELQRELAATMKEKVSVYFDTNPHDGLFETHNVNKSLEGKLRSIIFIPVLSQTYCDPASFAWKNEFLVFNKLSGEDKLGRDIRLNSGNVTGRILPVKIHNLDHEDKALIESEMGGALRSIDFIYAEAGVNRPLRPDDDAKENLNKTQFRNQVNKLANAVKEILIAAKNLDQGKIEKLNVDRISTGFESFKKPGRPKLKLAFWFLLVFIALVSGYLIIPRFSRSVSAPLDSSIAVLPLEDMSSNPEQAYFSDGIMQEILNHLFMIGGLKIPSATSSMRFKGSKLSVKEIAGELGVSYVLEGSVRTSGNNVRITVRLINGKNEQLLWTQDYNRTMTAIDLLDIQSDVAQKIAEKLKVVINPEVKKRIQARPTENTEAYLLFLQALVGNGQLESAKQQLEKAIVLDPGFADAYATLAFFSLIQGNDLYGKLSRQQVITKAMPLLKKAIELDSNSVMAHSYLASVNLWYNWDFNSVEKEYRIVNKLNPSSSDSYLEFVQYLLITGKFDEAINICQKALNDYDITGHKYVAMALAYCYSGQQDKALTTADAYLNIFQADKYLLYNSMRIYVSLGKYDKVTDLFEKNLGKKPVNELSDSFLGYIGIASYKTGNTSRGDAFLNELASRCKNPSSGSPFYFSAALHAAINEKDRAFQLLQSAYDEHETEMVWLKVDPLFLVLHGDQRYETLLKNIGYTQ